MSSAIALGQDLNSHDLERAGRAAASADLVIVLGSSLSVYPAASIPLLAAQKGIPYLIINQGKTDHDLDPTVNFRMYGDVLKVFPPAVEAISRDLHLDPKQARFGEPR